MLEIHGVPTVHGENTRDVVLATCKAVGVDLGPEAIDSCHRLPKGANQHSPGIIVKFVRRDDAHKVLDKKKHVRRLSTRDVGFQAEDRPVFINLSLTLDKSFDKFGRDQPEASSLQKAGVSWWRIGEFAGAETCNFPGQSLSLFELSIFLFLALGLFQSIKTISADM
ncbi:uncharacterized protein LOC111045838 [Nilaparvata lugens]|uniref:uncharacterized protein LOC111045838 n=1 Tax=Nilaparvata lugens TaxID=108931 RepID=UPI00193D7CE9|nr:uncharacterized protein LOC111045838 [Nilaparvata lugens]